MGCCLFVFQFALKKKKQKRKCMYCWQLLLSTGWNEAEEKSCSICSVEKHIFRRGQVFLFNSHDNILLGMNNIGNEK